MDPPATHPRHLLSRPDLDSDADSDEDTDSEIEADPETETAARLDSTATWGPSIPEPDPNKKPS